jgi:hypothetical protein
MPNPNTPDHIIVISATTAVPHPLTLTEGTTSSSTETGDQNFTTEVNSGDTVQWQFDSNSNISGISAVSVTRPFFSQLPSSDNQWIGRVGTSNGEKANESYTISYSVTGAPANPYTQDPIIKMKN